MIYGVIDLGSNTIRLTVYRIKSKGFKTLFYQKTMAGLAGYVKKGMLAREGIEKACEVLNSYKLIFKNFEDGHLLVFATASLRNIENQSEAVSEIFNKTGFTVEVISGEEEAALDFNGATHNVNMKNGILVDIGGGSTELVSYSDSEMITPLSIPLGSLSMYSKYVKKIMPLKPERKAIKKAVLRELDKAQGIEHCKYNIICGVGGTIRACLKLNNFIFSMPANNNEITGEHLRYIYDTLTENNSTVWNLILKVCPDRIHTIIPGICILKAILKYYESETIIVSSYGVREGYLYNRIIDNKNKKTEA